MSKHHNNNQQQQQYYNKKAEKKPKAVKFEVKKVYSDFEYQQVEQEFAEKHQLQQTLKFDYHTSDAATAPLADSTAQVEDCVAGSLFGLAYGDVIGCPVEGMKWPHIKSLYNDAGFSSNGYSKKPQETIYDPSIDKRPYYNKVPVQQLNAHHLQLVGGLKFVRHMYVNKQEIWKCNNNVTFDFDFCLFF